MDTAAWASDWPRCLLLLDLAARYAESGRAHGCAKLKDRLEEWRRRMEDAPPAVHALLSELCYVCWLVGRGELAAARHHAAEAQRKAKEIARTLRRWQHEQARHHASAVRRRSVQLQRKAQDLRERSDLLLAQAALLLRRGQSVPAQEAPASELLLA